MALFVNFNLERLVQGCWAVRGLSSHGMYENWLVSLWVCGWGWSSMIEVHSWKIYSKSHCDPTEGYGTFFLPVNETKTAFHYLNLSPVLLA